METIIQCLAILGGFALLTVVIEKWAACFYLEYVYSLTVQYLPHRLKELSCGTRRSLSLFTPRCISTRDSWKIS